MNFTYPLLLDGATGTNLIAAGMQPGERTADFVLATYVLTVGGSHTSTKAALLPIM